MVVAQDVVKNQGGWEYAKTFASKFDIEELASDMVRRRRWVRYMTSLDPCKSERDLLNVEMALGNK